MIVIPPARAFPGQGPRFLQVPYDALDRTLGYADLFGNVPQPCGRILGKSHEDMRVVAEECPGVVGLV